VVPVQTQRQSTALRRLAQVAASLRNDLPHERGFHRHCAKIAKGERRKGEVQIFAKGKGRPRPFDDLPGKWMIKSKRRGAERAEDFAEMG